MAGGYLHVRITAVLQNAEHSCAGNQRFSALRYPRRGSYLESDGCAAVGGDEHIQLPTAPYA